MNLQQVRDETAAMKALKAAQAIQESVKSLLIDPFLAFPNVCEKTQKANLKKLYDALCGYETLYVDTTTPCGCNRLGNGLDF